MAQRSKRIALVTGANKGIGFAAPVEKCFTARAYAIRVLR